MYKAIKGYEGIYEINEFGQVRSVDRIVKLKDGSVRKR
ncbi:NUMOD4 domain-containing protein, partial [Acinetobacter baumannii]